MAAKTHILIVEDNLNDAELMVLELQRENLDFDWERVDTEDEYVARLTPDLHLILCDFEMPRFNGYRALELLKQRHDLAIPFIVVSGTIGEEQAVESIKQGADDYLLKDRIARLGSAVRRALNDVEERRERVRLEAQFIEAQKMEVVGHLAGGVAHDFNNVLAVIMGYSELIVQDLGADHPLQKYIEEVRNAAKRASGLTQQLLIFSRKETVLPVELDLNDVVRDMQKMLQQLINENVELTMSFGKGIGPIKADSGYIWQVLMNLVVNARDAMPNGGKLSITTSTVWLDENDVKPGAYARLSVTDTGIGMTEEVKAHLFEAFFTTKAAGKGTGLGLLTCQTIVRQSKGHIEVFSEVGTGTAFNVYFPQVAAADSIATRKTSRIPIAPQGTETLLIVEDEPSLRQLARDVLLGQGYQVLVAANGEEALRIAREHKGAPIALVVTDVVMPRMGGRVMAEWLKTAIPNLKMLFTSGYMEEAVAHHEDPDQRVEFLPKPYTPTSLTRKVREILDS